MSERQITISISAIHATQAAFAAANAELAALRRGVKDTDDESKKSGSGLSSFFGDLKTSFAAAGIGVGAVTGAVGALAAGVIALGARGADVDDIEGSFESLNKTIGNDSTQTLATLKRAFAGTVSDFDLMKSANTALSLGLKASHEDFDLLGKASRVLADRTGGDAKTAFETLTQALATGKDGMLKSVAVNIDAQQAMVDYGRKIGRTVADMNEQQKTEAKAIAMKRELSRVLEESGEAQFDFADAIDASTVMVDNWKDSLSKAIATSPVVNAMLASFAKGLDAGFGIDQQAKIQSLMAHVNKFSIFLVDVANVALSGAGFIGRAWGTLDVVFTGAMVTMFNVATAAQRILTVGVETVAKLPLVGDKYKGLGEQMRDATNHMNGMRESFKEQFVEAERSAAGNDKWGKTVDAMKAGLGTMRGEMVKALSTKVELSAAADANTTAATKQHQAIAALSKEHLDASDKIRSLANDLRNAEKAKFSIKETTDKFGGSIKSAVLDAKLFGIKLPEEIAKAAKGITDAELATKMAKELYALNEKADKAGAEFQKEMYEMALKGGEQFHMLTGVVDKVQLEIVGMNKKGLDKQLFDLGVKMKEEITALGAVPKGYEREYGNAVAAIKQKYLLMEGEAKKSETDIVEIMKGQGVKTRSEMEKDVTKAKETYDRMKASHQFTAEQLESQWAKLTAAKEALNGKSAVSFDTLLGSMVDGFAKLSQIAGGSLSSVAKDVGSVFAAMKIGGDAAKSLADVWEKSSASMQDKMGAVAMSAPAMASSMIQATSSASTAMNAVGGAAAGAKMGMAFGGPWGAAVGAAVGLAIGLIRRTEHVEIMKDVGRQWGTAISDGLAKQIEADAKKWFNKDRVAGSIFNLDKVIQEAGGLNSKNYDLFIGKLHDVFSMIEIGRFSVDQGRDALDKSFGTFASQIDKSSGLAGSKLLEIMDLNDRFGTNSKAVADFVNSEAKRALGGIQTFAQNAQVSTQASADAMGTAVGGLFKKMVASGVPLTSALKDFEPVIDSLKTQFKTAGLDGGAAFAGITSMVDFMKDKVSGPAVTAVLGLNDVFVGLHNTRGLTQTGFEGFTGQVAATFKGLVDQGKDGNQALALMQPTLQTIWRLQKDFGYAVDEGTQSLLDQGMKAGIVGDKHRDAQDRIATAMDRVGQILELIARKWGVDLPESIGTFAGAATKAFDDAGGSGESFLDRTRAAIDGFVSDGIPVLKGGLDTIGRVFDTDIPDAALAGFTATSKLASGLVASVNKTLEGITREIEVDIDANVTRNDDGGSGGDPGFSTGGVIDAGAGRRAILHGRELIMPLDRPSPIATQFVRELVSLTPASSAGPVAPERLDRLERAVSTLTMMMTTLPGDLARAYRDSQLQLGARA